MRIEEKLKEICCGNGFGVIEIETNGNKDYRMEYYSNLTFGEIPERIMNKNLTDYKEEKVGNRTNYILHCA